MKKLLILMVVFALGFATFAIADKTKMTAKVGDELYVCACGEGCPCDTMSKSAGQCTCGKDMVKTKVTKVEADDTAGYPLSRVRRLANNKAC